MKNYEIRNTSYPVKQEFKLKRRPWSKSLGPKGRLLVQELGSKYHLGSGMETKLTQGRTYLLTSQLW